MGLTYYNNLDNSNNNPTQNKPIILTNLAQNKLINLTSKNYNILRGTSNNPQDINLILKNTKDTI